MQTCTLFPSTDLYFTNAFVAIVDDFHHSSFKKKTLKNKFQSHSLSSAWFRKQETTN